MSENASNPMPINGCNVTLPGPEERLAALAAKIKAEGKVRFVSEQVLKENFAARERRRTERQRDAGLNRGKAAGRARSDRRAGKQQCREALAAPDLSACHRGCPPDQLDQRDVGSDVGDAGGGMGEVEGQVQGEAGPGLSQADFVASGQGDSSNERLLSFFEQVRLKGQMGVWFLRTFLKEKCGNDLINNRVTDVRKVLAPQRLKLVNGQYSPDGVIPKASAYRLLWMTAAEVAKYEETKVPPTE